jgi:uncharacterized protein YjbI with pentapeptide repeats
MNAGDNSSRTPEVFSCGPSEIPGCIQRDSAISDRLVSVKRKEGCLSEGIIIIEDFYEHPYHVRELALRSRYANIEATDYPGFGSQLALSTPALRARFEEIIGARIVADNARFAWGSFRFVTAASGTRAIVHADAAVDWAIMIYLTPDAPASAGTGFYRHKVTGFTGPPTDREARALGYADASEFDDRVIRRDKRDLSKWELVQQVAPRFNRLVMFRGGEMYHAPLGGCGKDHRDARLAHIFFFNSVPLVQRWPHDQAVVNDDAAVIAPSGNLFDLVEVSKSIFGLSDDPGAFVLVPCSSIGLAQATAVGLVEEAVMSGEMFRTASELSDRGHGLHCLILAKLSHERAVLGHWIVDGWRLIREHGTALNLRHARLQGAQLAGAKLNLSDLSEADLRGADLRKSSLQHTRLTGALLAGANLSSATLSGANLTEADLCRTDLRHADLRNSICARTSFRGADVWNAYIGNVDFSEAFTDCVDFSRADMVVKSASERLGEHPRGIKA